MMYDINYSNEICVLFHWKKKLNLNQLHFREYSKTRLTESEKSTQRVCVLPCQIYYRNRSSITRGTSLLPNPEGKDRTEWREVRVVLSFCALC